MEKLYVGEEVILSALGRKCYKNTINNPHKGVGIVLLSDYDEVYPYRVMWSDGWTNSYRTGELERRFPLELKTLEDFM